MISKTKIFQTQTKKQVIFSDQLCKGQRSLKPNAGRGSEKWALLCTIRGNENWDFLEGNLVVYIKV